MQDYRTHSSDDEDTNLSVIMEHGPVTSIGILKGLMFSNCQ